MLLWLKYIKKSNSTFSFFVKIGNTNTVLDPAPSRLWINLVRLYVSDFRRGVAWRPKR